MVTVFVIGILVALLIEETTGLSPGGIIVPGFLALAWNDPLRIGATLVASMGAMGVVMLAQRYMFLYGRRRFAYSVLAGVAIKQFLATVLPMLRIMPWGLLIVGLVVPGLIAETSLRQGTAKTMVAILAGVVLTRLLAIPVTGWLP